MSRASQIQTGLLVLIALMVGYYVFTSSSSDSSVRTEAKQNLITNSKTPTTPAKEEYKGPKTSVKFAEEEFNFGTIDSGEKVEHIYAFTNDGDEPLVISEAKGSCGCTVPEWPKEPIAPGEGGEIKVVFDSKGKSGKQTKSVTIKANTDPAVTILKISGDVTPDPNAPKPSINANQLQPQIQPVQK